MTWTISGSVNDLTPAVAANIFGNATENDTFIIGPSGFGYQYPSDFPNIVKFAQITNKVASQTGKILV